MTWIAYLATRKRITVQYYLCPACADKRKIRTLTSSIVTFVAFAGLIVGAATGTWSMIAPFAGAALVSSVAWLAFASAPLKAVAHHDGLFSLKGASPIFLESVEERQLEHQ